MALSNRKSNKSDECVTFQGFGCIWGAESVSRNYVSNGFVIEANHFYFGVARLSIFVRLFIYIYYKKRQNNIQ